MRDRRSDLHERLLRDETLMLSPEEARASVKLLETAPPPLQRVIGNAWIRSGPPILGPVIAAQMHPLATVRRVAAFVLGELLAQSPSPAGTEALLQALCDLEPKVRKNAAIALGKAADPAAVEALVEQLGAETMDYVRPSIILTLGALGTPEARAALAALQPATDEDARARRLALERSGERALAPVAADQALEAELDLLCRPGLESVLARELKEAGIPAGAQGQGSVRLRWQGTLAQLQRLRTYEAVAFPVLDGPADPLASPALAAEAFARAPGAALAVALSAAPGQDEVRYRVTLDLPPRAGIKRRDWIAAFYERLSALAPHFVNSPGRYSWEFLIRFLRQRWYMGIVPTAYLDPRFAYRVADVPASLNPTIAAAMAALLPSAPGDIVLDPFCGSATPLIERARHAPAHTLIGVDQDEQALAAARQNLQAAGLADVAQLIRGDARRLADLLSDHGLGRVDAIITNPPYGVRVGAPEQIGPLYDAVIPQLAAVLRPGGRLAMLAKEASLLLKATARQGLTVERELRVDSGGILISLFVFRMR